MILRTGSHVSCDSDSQIFADPTGPEMPPFSGVVGDRGAAPAAGRAWGARQPARGNKSLQHLTKMARRWVSQGLQRCNSPIPANCGTPGHLMIARSTASEIPPTHPSGIIPEHPGATRSACATQPRDSERQPGPGGPAGGVRRTPQRTSGHAFDGAHRAFGIMSLTMPGVPLEGAHWPKVGIALSGHLASPAMQARRGRAHCE